MQIVLLILGNQIMRKNNHKAFYQENKKNFTRNVLVIQSNFTQK